ncbi:patatin-like phospholipase family protein [Phocaeicola sartorii]|uniref:patatin-like phospholipase family protein n=1 Tax=Phocaeicola sartorii TaxID=671267 RepID=UPI00242E3108|nr:patatin family protein [Phocaeicola sartorii]
METYNKGLVLEGGGLRGAFTIGVLDAFMKRKVYFPYVIGVSAGANIGLSYIARQYGRAFHCNIELLKKYNYVGLKHFFRGKGYINLEYLLRTYPQQFFPFDFEAYRRAKERFVMVTSNCLTGEAEYWEEKNNEYHLMNICQASCSLPVMCPVRYLNGIPMTDGGVCDSIPILHAINEGLKNNVVILTQNKGYRKPQKKFYLPRFVLNKYPAIRKKISLRYKLYNEELDYVEELERKGIVHIIRPQRKLEVTRTTTNFAKLERLYQEGFYEGVKFLDDISQ